MGVRTQVNSGGGLLASASEMVAQGRVRDDQRE